MNDDLIAQTVNYGSVYTALKKEQFTCADLLFWLSNQESISDRHYVAYGACCHNLNPNEHYLANGKHFLRVKQEYLYIALQYQLDLEIPESHGSEDQLYGFILDENINLNINPDRCRLLCCASGFATKTLKFDIEHYELCFLARYFPHMKESPQINEGLVNTDWISKFRYNDKLPMLVINRVRVLSENAPIYYEKVIRDEYNTVAKNIYQNKLIYNLTSEELSLFCEYFPNIIPQQILDLSDNIRKISLLGNDVAGYLLGYPIDKMIPDEKRIMNALEKMGQMSEEDFVKMLETYTKNAKYEQGPYSEHCDYKFANQTDVMMESLESYLLFDIVHYQDGDYIYRFSRAEFDDLLESKKNPWTNSWLPESILSSMKNKAELAKKLKLPPCVPIAELYSNLNKGILFTPENVPTPKSEESSQDSSSNSRHFELGQLLASFFMAQSD